MLYDDLFRMTPAHCPVFCDPHSTNNILLSKKVQCKVARYINDNYDQKYCLSKMLLTLVWKSLQDHSQTQLISEDMPQNLASPIKHYFTLLPLPVVPGCALVSALVSLSVGSGFKSSGGRSGL